MTTHPREARVTERAREIEETLSRILPEPESYADRRERLGALSLIGRSSATYARIQEIYCSVDLSSIPSEEERISRQESGAERRISDLCESLGETLGGGRILPVFRGDPRGICVSLRSSIPEETDRIADCWDREIGLGIS